MRVVMVSERELLWLQRRRIEARLAEFVKKHNMNEEFIRHNIRYLVASMGREVIGAFPKEADFVRARVDQLNSEQNPLSELWGAELVLLTGGFDICQMSAEMFFLDLTEDPNGWFRYFLDLGFTLRKYRVFVMEPVVGCISGELPSFVELCQRRHLAYVECPGWPSRYVRLDFGSQVEFCRRRREELERTDKKEELERERAKKVQCWLKEDSQLRRVQSPRVLAKDCQIRTKSDPLTKEQKMRMVSVLGRILMEREDP